MADEPKNETGASTGLFEAEESAESADLLSAELGGCIEFPIEALPRILRPFITQGARAIQCPPDYIAVPLLTCLGAAIGRTRMIEVKKGWLEPTALWTAVVGGSGTAKSPAYSLATEPLQEMQQMLMAEATEDSKVMRIVVCDTTVEALASVMSGNPRGLILMRDELAGWFRSMNQYKSGRGSDEQFFLSTWSGQSCAIDRRNMMSPLMITKTYLAITGTVQPEILRRSLDKERHEDGFAARLLISCPPEIEREWVDHGITDQLKKPITNLFHQLIGLQFMKDQPAFQPIVVQFSPEGYKAFKEVMNDHLKQKDRYGLDGYLVAYWAKMEGYAARLSLIVHIVRCCAKETKSQYVDAKSVYMAATLVDYFKSHIARFYGGIKRRHSISLSERIVAWVQKYGKTEISCRDIYTARIVLNAETARQAFDAMARKGLGHWKTAEGKQKFILTYSQHSATQQTQQETLQTGNQSTWLARLGERPDSEIESSVVRRGRKKSNRGDIEMPLLNRTDQNG